MADEPVIYVVDDDQASAASVEALMMADGLTVKTFRSAEAFLAGFDDKRPGCLVVDVRLEGMSGLELQKQIAARGIALATIMISGHADEALGKEARANGALAFLEKPFAGRELCAWVGAALAGRGQAE